MKTVRTQAIFIVLILLIIISLSSFNVGAYFEKNKCSICSASEGNLSRTVVCETWRIFQRNDCPEKTIDLSLFWETWNALQDNYVDKSKIDNQKMIFGAISGMVSSLGDPYTVFFDPTETKKFIDDSRGQFEGVGMEIGVQKNQLQVVTPIEGTPAKKAGMRAGDLIVKIDGKTTINMSIDEAIGMIRGPKGTEVTLSIYREEWKEIRDIKLVRDVIDIPSVNWKLIDNEIAYIQLYQFTERAGSEFEQAGIEILNSPAKKIILDLRNNPGGYLNIAQNVAGWFLDKGQLVTTEDMGEGKTKEEYRSEGPSLFAKYPIVVLINRGSASGSEILAGALRDVRGIKLIGEKSFGKGSVQQLEPLGGGSSLKVTTAKWLTPKGEQISEKGLNADVEIKNSLEDEQNNKDPQLDKAIEIIKEIR